MILKQITAICLKLPAYFAVALVSVYQYLFSPLIHAIGGPSCGCRFEPSCSNYAKGALNTHGFFFGSWLTLKRILRCNPCCQGGHDPVPQTQNHFFKS